MNALRGVNEHPISVRDWRRKLPLRLRVRTKLGIWCWIKCERCPHMSAVDIAPYIVRWGRTGGRTCCGGTPAAPRAAPRAWRCNTRAGEAPTRAGRR